MGPPGDMLRISAGVKGLQRRPPASGLPHIVTWCGRSKVGFETRKNWALREGKEPTTKRTLVNGRVHSSIQPEKKHKGSLTTKGERESFGFGVWKSRKEDESF